MNEHYAGTSITYMNNEIFELRIIILLRIIIYLFIINENKTFLPFFNLEDITIHNFNKHSELNI